MANYWTKLSQQRIGRRRTILGASTAALGTAFLAACGSDEASPATATGTTTGSMAGGAESSLVSPVEDTSSQARRGGVNKWVRPNEPAHLDVHIDQAPNNSLKNLVYGQLTTERPGHNGERPAYNDVDPDLAESWEWSPDYLTLTMKLRRGVKWHNKPPVNGRDFDMQDVLFSWNRYSEIGTDRSSMVNAVNPNAPVLSFEATDDTTVRIQLSEPVFYLVNAFAFQTTGKPIMIPREADGPFDIRQDMIGTGPFMLEQYTPTVAFKFRRNEEYWDSGRPYIDEIEAPIIPEYTQALAQLKAGAIYTYAEGNNVIQAEDVLPTKQEQPDLQIYANEPLGVTIRTLSFGNQPGGNPFADERVRQALSMAQDRDLYINTFSNVDRYEAGGLPVTTYWNSHLFCGYADWWLDPRSSDFGENSQYFQYNPEEARRLLDAAGYGDGVDVTGAYIGGPQLGPAFQAQAEVMDGFAQEVGFRINVNVVDYVSEYIPVYRDGNGRFEGWAYRIGVPSAADPVAFLTWRFHSLKGGPGFLGFDLAGRGDGSGDPEVDGLLDRARGEMDTDARRELVYELQSYLGGRQYTITDPGQATNFLLTWPVLRNYQAFLGERRTPNFDWWIDDTRAPLA